MNLPPIEKVDAPEHLRPQHSAGWHLVGQIQHQRVRIFLLDMSEGLMGTIKHGPAWFMLDAASKQPDWKGVNTVVAESSGGMGYCLSLIARNYHDKECIVVVKEDLERGKLLALEQAGAQIIKATTPFEVVEELGARPSHLEINQYGDPANALAHQTITGPLISDKLGLTPSLVVCAMGSTGTVCGLEPCFPDRVLGVMVAPGGRVPGARTKAQIEAVTLPWEERIGMRYLEVTQDVAYGASIKLQKRGFSAGPSTGLAFQGMRNYLNAATDKLLAPARDDDGMFNVVVVMADRASLYPDQYQRYFPI